MPEEVYYDFQTLNMALFCPYYESYNIQSRDGGGTKWRILPFSVQSPKQKAMEDGKEFSWQRYVTLRTTALEGT
jgi:hypothetical protein